MLHNVDTVQVCDPQQYCWGSAQVTMIVLVQPVIKKNKNYALFAALFNDEYLIF